MWMRLRDSLREVSRLSIRFAWNIEQAHRNEVGHDRRSQIAGSARDSSDRLGKGYRMASFFCPGADAEAHLVQAVFPLGLGVNFHFHHHRVRTRNVAKHVGLGCDSSVHTSLEQPQQTNNSNRGPAFLSPRHDMGVPLVTCVRLSLFSPHSPRSSSVRSVRPCGPRLRSPVADYIAGAQGTSPAPLARLTNSERAVKVANRLPRPIRRAVASGAAARRSTAPSRGGFASVNKPAPDQADTSDNSSRNRRFNGLCAALTMLLSIIYGNTVQK